MNRPRWWCRNTGARSVATISALLVVAASSLSALDGRVVVLKPDLIAFELAPIQVELTLPDPDRQTFAVEYHVHDFYKTEVAKGAFTLAAESGGADEAEPPDQDAAAKPREIRHAITFTPPKWGWYVVSFDVSRAGEHLGSIAGFASVTPPYPGVQRLGTGESRLGWSDEARQAFCGLMLDRANTNRPDFLDATVESARKYGVTLLAQFEGQANCTPEHVREMVTRFSGRVKYWEIMQEPNFTLTPEQYVALVKELAPIIKGIDPAAKILGLDVCGVDLDWYTAAYKAGIGPFLDIISIHDNEGDHGIDPWHWRWKLGELRKIMAANGDAGKPIWQTERAIGGVLAKVFIGCTQAVRLTLHRDLLETLGIANDHDFHYYLNDVGYSDVPTYLFSSSGWHPAALATRTRYAMTKDRAFLRKLDFGPTGNQLFLGLLYQGADGATMTLRNLGTLDQALELDVEGKGPLHVVDAFGNESSLPVQNGKATVTVRQMPTYLRLGRGQSVAVPKIDFGENIAPQATFAYSGETRSDPKLLANGKFEIDHHQYPDRTVWTGGFGQGPQTLTISFATSQTIGKLVVYGRRADNQHCAILDYDLQYHDDKDWVTIEQVRTPCPASDAVRTHLCQAMSWYQDNSFVVHQFKPVTTDRLRLVITRLTRGFMADAIAETAAGCHVSSERLELREIEIYRAPSPGDAKTGSATSK